MMTSSASISEHALQLQFLTAFYQTRAKLSPGDQGMAVLNKMIGEVRREIRTTIRDELADRLEVQDSVRENEHSGLVAVVVQTTAGPHHLNIQVYMVKASVIKVECFIRSIYSAYEGQTICWLTSPALAPTPRTVSVGVSQDRPRSALSGAGAFH